MISNTRLYGATIAFASGLYSVWSTTVMSGMGASGWLMLLLGIVVIIHGAVLLSDSADRLGTASGPLMIVYASAMLLIQAALGTGLMTSGGEMGMDGTIGMGGSAISAGMGWDAGMVTLAVVMLASGLIMSRGSRTAETDTM